jgi:hypothetical protein
MVERVLHRQQVQSEAFNRSFSAQHFRIRQDFHTAVRPVDFRSRQQRQWEEPLRIDKQLGEVCPSVRPLIRDVSTLQRF